MRAPSVDAACDIVESLPFALTGGLFSRSPATVEQVRAAHPVGNLYVNRGITGAMVGRQPFGGNRRSGVGSKAGGPDYLLQFVEPRVVYREHDAPRPPDRMTLLWAFGKRSATQVGSSASPTTHRDS